MRSQWLLYFLVLGHACPGLASPLEDWQHWKGSAYKKALESKTSFLNAYALNHALKGQTLYLTLSTTRANTHWVTRKPKKYHATAEHLGDKIRVQVKGKTQTYLSNRADKRRYQFDLPNGAIAEVVYGKRNHKLWAYLYNPEQIKEFSGFRFFPFNADAIVSGAFKKQKPQFVTYKTVQGDPTQVNKVGNLSFVLNGKEFFLPAYNWQPQTESVNYVAVVFTDETKGIETYPGGRELVIELDGPLRDGQNLTLDFNRTMNFYCAHSPFWHCPVGLQKHLNTAVRAGEQLPLKKIVPSNR